MMQSIRAKMQFNLSEEFYKGITDLPIFILAVFFALYLLKDKTKRRWITFFFMLAASSLLGCVAHIVSLTPIAKKILWTVLYILLYETIRQLVIVLSKKSKVVFIVEISLFIATIILLYLNSPYDIYVLVLFGMFAFAYIIKHSIQFGFSKKLKAFLLFCILAILFQALKSAIPFGVALGHGAIIVAICLLFSIAKE